MFGKVIQVLSTKRVIINLGEDDQIKVGDKIIAFEEGPMIQDEEGNDIELFEIIKAELEIIKVQKMLSVAESVTEITYYERTPLLSTQILYGSRDVKEKRQLDITTTENITSPELNVVLEQDFNPVKQGDKIRVLDK